MNPFAELSATIPLAVMQAYVVVMALLVVGGTLIDVIHKGSAKFFFEKSKSAEAMRKRELGGGEKMGIAVKTVAEDVLTSAEFCNPKRRMSHLLTMYGFIVFLVSTIGLVFAYTDRPAPALVAQLWHLGAAMVCVGGYWFWFCIRVDVSAEGNPWYRVVRADLFILSLLGTTTFGLIWSLTGAGTNLWLALFIIASTVLFGGVLWSKFAHMFFKPAAAFQKRVMKADGSRENMPEIGDLSDPELQKKFPDIPEYLGEKPGYMGLGIKREQPRHY
ncbi:MAG: hypothetical protein OXR84_15950 [Magnetovibrio sp.]|nr:hypothetical protein [Magnetovibrio sp.]